MNESELGAIPNNFSSAKEAVSSMKILSGLMSPWIWALLCMNDSSFKIVSIIDATSFSVNLSRFSKQSSRGLQKGVSSSTTK